MIPRLVYASVGLAAVCLAAGLALAGSWPWAAAALGLGALWLAGQWRQWPSAAALGFATSVALAVLSLWLSAKASVALLALLAVVAALWAWDLDGLARRLARYTYVGDRGRLERQHLGRLLIVSALGLLLGLVALALRIRLTFLPALLLSLLTVLGLSWAIFLLRTEDS